jgi:uncharacterized RDD family membrane protein YckC
MSTIKIITTQNIELEFELANVGERLVAWLIDLVIFILYFSAVLLIINLMDLAFRQLENKPWQAISLGLLIGTPFIFYNLGCEIWLNGQTIGKKVMGIKVVGIKGGQATFSQYLIRWVFRLVDIYIFDGLPAFVCILISDQHQRIGDIVAGTTVIRTRLRSTLQHTLFVPTQQPAYAVSFPEIAQLTDGDMQLVKEVINLVNQTGNTMLAYQTAEKIKKILNIQSNMEPIYFLQVILADFNYLTSMPSP